MTARPVTRTIVDHITIDVTPLEASLLIIELRELLTGDADHVLVKQLLDKVTEAAAAETVDR